MKIAFKRSVCVMCCVCEESKATISILSCPGMRGARSAQLDAQREKPECSLMSALGGTAERVECIALPGPLTFASQ